MTLKDFLAEHSICRLWYTAVGSPTGREFFLVSATYDEEDDEPIEDGVEDPESLLSVLEQFGAEEVEGTVSVDGDGEVRWEAGDLEGCADCRSNSLTQLVVWGN